ncbi:CoA transferase [Azoarcus sp. L1K30]|uniref:CoA transferase n=1 Tax=Azoarcus sp. L1K30 TaxID=2820277 RepID=UPI001B80F477|nr:CoA transferase [Azoarcus sp. L1K30]MBR0567464.1 CoA transferase [Azoarcus sp. L1K30]
MFERGDPCVAPVLSLDEASDHPHNRARKAFIEVDGIYQPAPAPRFSRTPGAVGGEVPSPGADTAAILRELGFLVP